MLCSSSFNPKTRRQRQDRTLGVDLFPRRAFENEIMDEKITKLQAATDEAEEQMKVCKEALDMTEKQLAAAKAKYKELPMEEQEKLQVNNTELPEWIETKIRAKNVYETVEARYNTNKRYLDACKAKMSSGCAWL